MTNAHHHNPRPRRISRREFLKLAAVAGLLAGCRSLEPPAKAPSEPIVLPPPRLTDVPTAPPAPTLTPAPTATPTAAPWRPGVIQMYPDVPSRVVRARHAGVWDGDTLVPEAIGQMLDASITQLTGLDDVNAAWAALFDPGECIAIKVNTIVGSSGWTHVPLVTAVTERLQAAGIPPEQIIVFDRDSYELINAGYTINQDKPGVRCYGTDSAYTDEGWTVADMDVRLSSILLNCDALINVPILKQHMYAGVSFAMKNHYGTCDRPSFLHPPYTKSAIAELNALAPLRDRQRLIVGDVMTVVLGDNWESSTPGDSILMSFDPVASDAVALQVFSQVLKANGKDPAGYIEKANVWLANSVALGLGTDDPAHMELVELNVG